MYRNFHDSGEVDAEFDDICEGGSGTQYRITANSTQKKAPRRKVVYMHDFGLKIFYIWGNRVSWASLKGPHKGLNRALLGPDIGPYSGPSFGSNFPFVGCPIFLML